MSASKRIFVAFLLATIARPALAADGGLGVQPIEAWLVGVLVLVLITIFGRHRSARNSAARTRAIARNEH